MPRKDSVLYTLIVAVGLCLVCSLLVSSAAVLLRDFQQANKKRELRKNVLVAAGLFDEATHTVSDIEDLYRRVTPLIVDLRTGDVVAAEEFTQTVGLERLEDYEQRQAARDESLSARLSLTEDPASIRRREHFSYVFLVEQPDEPDLIVLPVRGYGLWSTLYGFIALNVETLRQGPEDAEIRGLTFYEHAETPGLGGEVDNPRWKSQWQGKKAFDENWNVMIEVAKAPREPDHQVEAISGATITSNGVTNMLQFWLGETGFGPFLRRVASGEAALMTSTQPFQGGRKPLKNRRFCDFSASVECRICELNQTYVHRVVHYFEYDALQNTRIKAFLSDSEPAFCLKPNALAADYPFPP